MVVEAMAIVSRSEELLSEKELRELAERDLAELTSLIERGLEPHVLTFAAEALGDHAEPNDPNTVKLLLKLVEHASPVVREGAIYGLEPHLASAGVVEALRNLRLHDDSPGVREAASSVLHWTEESDEATSDS